MALHELRSASGNLHAASDEFSADPDIDTIEAMQHIREQAAREMQQPDRRKNIMDNVDLGIDHAYRGELIL